MFGNMQRALRHKNYRLYFIGQGVSLIGNWLSDVAIAWMVYRITRDSHAENAAMGLGIVGFAERIPMLVLSPILAKRRRCARQELAAFLLRLPSDSCCPDCGNWSTRFILKKEFFRLKRLL